MSAAPITAMVLAGGQGTRMGGLDKGLQAFGDQPLAWHAAQRLQAHPLVARVLISANRHLDQYQALGWPVVADRLGGYQGPLAGFLSALEHADGPYALTVPCDTPCFPADLPARLLQALQEEGADLALVLARSAPSDTQAHRQPAFCLMRRGLQPSLQAFLDQGGRKIGAWAAQHRLALVPFGPPNAEAHAFFNLNTLDDLRQLQTLANP
ncbi:MAG: molybdenum cofactor guanylyltransferase MobA [Rhodoferax sp.]